MRLEALREVVNLLEHAVRKLAQRLRLSHEHTDGFLGLGARLLGRLPDDGGVLREHLVKLHRLAAEGAFNEALMLGKHAIDLERVLAEGRVDRFEPLFERGGYELSALGEGRVEGDGALMNCRGERIGALLERLSKGRGLLGEGNREILAMREQGLVERLGSFSDCHGQHVDAVLHQPVEAGRAVAHRFRKSGEPLFQKRVELHGAVADALREGIDALGEELFQRRRLVADRVGEKPRMLGQGRVERLDAGRERVVERSRPFSDGRLQGGEIGCRSVDDLAEPRMLDPDPLQKDRHLVFNLLMRELDLRGGLGAPRRQHFSELLAALGQALVEIPGRFGEVASNLGANPPQGFADPVAVIGKSLALAGKLADEPADTQLVLAVGALEGRNLIMHERLKLAGTANGAGDGIVHGRHLPADRLAKRGDRLLGEPVRLSQPDCHFGHGGRHEPQFLSAPDEEREEPEKGDRQEDRHRRGHHRRIGKDGTRPTGGRVGDRAAAPGENDADDEPADRGDGRN